MAGIDFTAIAEGRYDRQRLIPWWDQDKLLRAHVVVVGAGALGNEVLKQLALLGFGSILVVDRDVVSPSNLARAVLFREGDAGRPKVEVAVERVRHLNPDVRIVGIHGDVHVDVGLGEFRRADVVFGCLDSVNARWAVNRACRRAGVPWIDGGISDFHGQITRYEPDHGACYECTFTDATFDRFNRTYSCPYGLRSRSVDRAVPTTAVTTSVVAALQVEEALHLIHRLPPGDGLEPGERLTIYVRPYRLVRDRLPPNPRCLAHDPLPVAVPVCPAGWTAPIRDLFEWVAAHDFRADDLELNWDLVAEFVCDACGRRDGVLRPKEKVYQDESRCPRCGASRRPELVSTITPTSALADRSPRSVGIPANDVLCFRLCQNGAIERFFVQLGS